MSTIFDKILSGEVPCQTVWEDETHLAFLDIRPVRPGHTLVIPKRAVSYLFEMSADEYTALWNAVRTVEDKLRKKTGCARVVVMVIGWEVAHVHVHLILTDELGDVGMPPPCEMTDAQRDEIAALLTV